MSDKKLYEMLMLECFQAGLTWECVLNKRENIRQAFDDFDVEIAVVHVRVVDADRLQVCI